jgi:cytoskeletal protein RodZ
MGDNEQETVEEQRRQRTRWLMAGGAASLLIPLLGALYLHWSDSAVAPKPSNRNDVFERHEGGERRSAPPQLPAPSPAAKTRPAVSKGSSLDFIDPGEDMRARVNPAVAPASTAAPTIAPAAPAPTAPKAKQGPKAFSPPKLQKSRGFSNMKPSQKASAADSQTPDTQDLLKNLPAGAENNPLVQQYLKTHP